MDTGTARIVDVTHQDYIREEEEDISHTKRRGLRSCLGAGQQTVYAQCSSLLAGFILFALAGFTLAGFILAGLQYLGSECIVNVQPAQLYDC